MTVFNHPQKKIISHPKSVILNNDGNHYYKSFMDEFMQKKERIFDKALNTVKNFLLYFTAPSMEVAI